MKKCVKFCQNLGFSSFSRFPTPAIRICQTREPARPRIFASRNRLNRQKPIPPIRVSSLFVKTPRISTIVRLEDCENPKLDCEIATTGQTAEQFPQKMHLFRSRAHENVDERKFPVVELLKFEAVLLFPMKMQSVGQANAQRTHKMHLEVWKMAESLRKWSRLPT